MKFNIQREELLLFSKRLAIISSSNIKITSLNNFHKRDDEIIIKACKETNIVTFFYSSLTIKIEYSVRTFVSSPGIVLVPVHFINMIELGSFKNIKISLNEENETIEISDENFCAEIHVHKIIDNNEYEERKNAMFQDEFTDLIEVKSSLITGFIDKNVYFSSKDVYYSNKIGGAMLSIDENSLSFYSTTGRMLTKCSVNLDSSEIIKVSKQGKILINESTMSEVNNCASLYKNSTIKILNGKGVVSFLIKNPNFDEERMIITSYLKQYSEYPNLGAFVKPFENITNYITVDRKDLIRKVKLSSSFMSKNDYVIKLNITKDNIFLSVTSKEMGGIKSSVSIKHSLNDDIIIGMDPKHFISSLRKFKSKDINLHFLEKLPNNRQLVIRRPVGDTSENYNSMILVMGSLL